MSEQLPPQNPDQNHDVNSSYSVDSDGQFSLFEAEPKVIESTPEAETGEGTSAAAADTNIEADTQTRLDKARVAATEALNQQAADKDPYVKSGHELLSPRQGGFGPAEKRDKNDAVKDEEAMPITTIAPEDRPRTKAEQDAARAIATIMQVATEANYANVHGIRGALRLGDAIGLEENMALTPEQRAVDGVKNDLAWAMVKELINWNVLTTGSNRLDTTVLSNDYTYDERGRGSILDSGYAHSEQNSPSIHATFGGRTAYGGTSHGPEVKSFSVRKAAPELGLTNRELMKARLKAIQNTRPSEEFMKAYLADFDIDRDGNTRTLHQAIEDAGGVPSAHQSGVAAVQPYKAPKIKPAAEVDANVSEAPEPLNEHTIIGRLLQKSRHEISKTWLGPKISQLSMYKWFNADRQKHLAGTFHENLIAHRGPNYGTWLERDLRDKDLQFKLTDDVYEQRAWKASESHETAARNDWVRDKSDWTIKAYAQVLRATHQTYRKETTDMVAFTNKHYPDRDEAIRNDDEEKDMPQQWENLLNLRDRWQRTLSFEDAVAARDAAYNVLHTESELHQANRNNPSALNTTRYNQAQYYAALFYNLTEEGRMLKSARSIRTFYDAGKRDGSVRYQESSDDNPNHIVKEWVIHPDGSRDEYPVGQVIGQYNNIVARYAPDESPDTPRR